MRKETGFVGWPKHGCAGPPLTFTRSQFIERIIFCENQRILHEPAGCSTLSPCLVLGSARYGNQPRFPSEFRMAKPEKNCRLRRRLGTLRWSWREAAASRRH